MGYEVEPLFAEPIFRTDSHHAIVAKTGEIPPIYSGLQQYVEANTTNESRFPIAFNTFIRGKIGDYRDVSALTLT